MNLIIRSQDKETLLAVNNLSVKKKWYKEGFEPPESWKVPEYYDIYTRIDNKDIILGEYETKDRALEILDETASILNHERISTANDEAKFDIEELESGIIGSYYKNSGQTIHKLDLVYNMPKE